MNFNSAFANFCEREKVDARSFSDALIDFEKSQNKKCLKKDKQRGKTPAPAKPQSSKKGGCLKCQ